MRVESIRNAVQFGPSESAAAILLARSKEGSCNTVIPVSGRSDTAQCREWSPKGNQWNALFHGELHPSRKNGAGKGREGLAPPSHIADARRHLVSPRRPLSRSPASARDAHPMGQLQRGSPFTLPRFHASRLTPPASRLTPYTTPHTPHLPLPVPPESLPIIIVTTHHPSPVAHHPCHNLARCSISLLIKRASPHMLHVTCTLCIGAHSHILQHSTPPTTANHRHPPPSTANHRQLAPATPNHRQHPLHHYTTIPLHYYITMPLHCYTIIPLHHHATTLDCGPHTSL
jgi:hypothetical protein